MLKPSRNELHKKIFIRTLFKPGDPTTIIWSLIQEWATLGDTFTNGLSWGKFGGKELQHNH